LYCLSRSPGETRYIKAISAWVIICTSDQTSSWSFL